LNGGSFGYLRSEDADVREEGKLSLRSLVHLADDARHRSPAARL